MNLLLPYCPESLERLVDRCNHCKKALGWFHSHGVTHCDQCARQVDRSAEAPLPEHLADDYGLFALLSSPDGRGVEEGRAQLPAALAEVSPGSLVRLALLIGGLVQPTYVPTAARHDVTRLPAPTLARVVCAGTAALRSWPDSFRSWVAAQSVELRGSPAALETLRARMKRLADRKLEADDLVRAVTSAMPDLHRHAAHDFAVDRPYYLYKPVQEMLGLSSPRMDALKKWPDIIFLKLNTGAKEQGQFDVAQIDGLVPVFRDTLGPGTCAERLGLPHYAIEQLCAAGILEWEDHPALLATSAAPKVRGASLRRLIEDLEGKVRGAKSDGDLGCDGHDGKMPGDLVSLSSASRRIGGRLKPWASIVDGLRKGSITFWMGGETPNTKSIRVRARDLARFDTVVDMDACKGFAPAATVTQRDAAEILNIAPKYMPALSIDLRFPFSQEEQALVASRASVLAAAARVAWDAEVALHAGVHYNSVKDIVAARGINPLPSGWPRARLIAAGMLPPQPEAEDPRTGRSGSINGSPTGLSVEIDGGDAEGSERGHEGGLGETGS